MIKDGNFKGVIDFIGKPIETKKGMGIGFKFKDSDKYLNIWVKIGEELPLLSKGMVIEGEYKDNNDYLIVSKYNIIQPQTIPLHQEFKQARTERDEIQEIIDKNIVTLGKIHDSLISANYFGYTDEDVKQDILISLFIETTKTRREERLYK